MMGGFGNGMCGVCAHALLEHAAAGGRMFVRQFGGQDKQGTPQLFLAALERLRSARVAISPSTPLALISCANWLR